MSEVGTFHSVPFPWPEAPSDAQYRTAATATGLTASQTPTVVEKARIDQVLNVLSTRMEHYAPDAPVSVKREAARLFHEVLKRAAPDLQEVMATSNVGIEYMEDDKYYELFRRSGAEDLLKPFRPSGLSFS